MPKNTGGFGAVEATAQVFARNEPMQSQLMELNDWLGIDVVKFEKYELLAGEANKQ